MRPTWRLWIQLGENLIDQKLVLPSLLREVSNIAPLRAIHTVELKSLKFRKLSV